MYRLVLITHTCESQPSPRPRGDPYSPSRNLVNPSPDTRESLVCLLCSAQTFAPPRHSVFPLDYFPRLFLFLSELAHVGGEDAHNTHNLCGYLCVFSGGFSIPSPVPAGLSSLFPLVPALGTVRALSPVPRGVRGVRVCDTMGNLLEHLLLGAAAWAEEEEVKK